MYGKDVRIIMHVQNDVKLFFGHPAEACPYPVDFGPCIDPSGTLGLWTKKSGRHRYVTKNARPGRARVAEREW